jgi:hypothetical protein
VNFKVCVGLEYLVDVVVETTEAPTSGYAVVIEDISGFFEIGSIEQNVARLSTPLNQTRGMVVDLKTSRFRNLNLNLVVAFCLKS